MNNVNQSPEEYLSSWAYQKFQEAMVAKSPFMKQWEVNDKAYYGTLNKSTNKPSYKSDMALNYVFKTIETIRPIMIDNNPIFQAMARTEDGMQNVDGIQKALTYEWDRTRMSSKIAKSLIPTLVKGNSIFYVPWNPQTNEVECILVNPYNIYPDPLAESLEESEYIIYATYKHVNSLKKLFPNKSVELMGGDIKYSELVDKKDQNASGISNQVLVLEIWMKDYTTVEEEEKDQHGNLSINSKPKYPNGRVVTVCPELDVVLSDRKNPYKDGKFPFVHVKDYDIPFQFWGLGDVEQIISPQFYLNELNNQIVDNAKHVGNAQWIVDKNAGIAKNALTNRPGLIVRKTPGSEVRRESPPSMPGYIDNKVSELKGDMETISGIHESLSGERPTGIQAGSAIQALQEASQTRIRLKVKMLEHALENLANMWFSRLQQFWKSDRFVRVTKEDGDYDFENITTEMLKYGYDIKVTAGSTMPSNKGAKLDLMLRLAQTTAEDGLPLVDRRSILEFVDLKDKKGLLERMDTLAGQGTVQQQLEQFIEQYEGEKKETLSVLDELANNVKELGTAVSRMEEKQDKVLNENHRLQIAQKSYKEGRDAGLKEIPPDLADDEKAMLQLQRDNNSDAEFDEQLKSGVLPQEVIDELMAMDDDDLDALIKQYPQIEEMLANMENMPQ